MAEFQGELPQQNMLSQQYMQERPQRKELPQPDMVKEGGRIWKVCLRLLASPVVASVRAVAFTVLQPFQELVKTGRWIVTGNFEFDGEAELEDV